MHVTYSEDPCGNRGALGRLLAAPACPAEAPIRLLQVIGLELDRDIYPDVLDGGLVAPSETAAPQYLGAETNHDRARPVAVTSGTPAPGTRPSPETTPPSTGATASPASPSASVERSSIRAHYENELGAVQGAYPGTRIWHDQDGMWLLSESSIVQGLNRAATFLVAFSWSQMAARGWGFWRNGALAVRWIGPRHTNFPDGSMCAFEPTDRTWVFGSSIVTLLDLYTVWALRHLHLELFNRWPGPQAAFHPYERRMEFHANERCSCGSGRMYRGCCASRDAARRLIPDAVSFAVRFAGGRREPPARLAQVALNVAHPPPICTVKWA